MSACLNPCFTAALLIRPYQSIAPHSAFLFALNLLDRPRRCARRCALFCRTVRRRCSLVGASTLSASACCLTRTASRLRSGWWIDTLSPAAHRRRRRRQHQQQQLLQHQCHWQWRQPRRQCCHHHHHEDDCNRSLSHHPVAVASGERGNPV